MFDKVTLFQFADEVKKDNENIIKKFENAEEKVNLQTGETLIYGNIGTMKLCQSFGGLSIRGSLPKYLYGNNIYPLDKKTTNQALEKLSDELQIKVKRAKVTALEFGNTFLMNNKPKNYLIRLGNLTRYNRVSYTDDTLYYRTNGKRQSKVFCFYNKGEEMRKKNVSIPKTFEGQNLLKYEIRLNGGIARQLKMKEVLGQTLTEYEINKRLLEMYKKVFLLINKVPQIPITAMGNITTVKGAKDYLFAYLLRQAGIDQINDFIINCRCADMFKNKQEYSRLKSELMKLTSFNVSDDDLLEELKNDILNTGKNL